MRQLNVNVTPEFERDLRAYMKARKIATKSDAIRQAVHEAAERNLDGGEFDFHAAIGRGLKGPENPNRQFLTEDDLWS